MTLHWWMHWFWVTALAIAVVGDGNVTAPSNDSSSVPVNTEATTVDAIINYNVTTSSTVTSTASHNISTTSEKPWGPGMYVTLTNIPSMTHDNVTSETDDVTTMPEVTTTNGTMTVVVSDDRNVSESYREGKAINTTNGTLIEDVSASSASPSSGIDAVTVSAISFGLLVLVALSGATGLVLYRRRYLNRPQTLNDKCSDPDSSGYIDDSTLRENSEEMYSLDNDSFLNSLEAMTIQNYWTDSVKHTKL